MNLNNYIDEAISAIQGNTWDEFVEKLTKEAKRIRVRVKRIEEKVAWVWFDQDHERNRRNIMHRYVTGLLRKHN